MAVGKKVLTGSKCQININGRPIMMADGVSYSFLHNDRMLRKGDRIVNINGLLQGVCDFVASVTGINRMAGEWEAANLLDYERDYYGTKPGTKSARLDDEDCWVVEQGRSPYK